MHVTVRGLTLTPYRSFTFHFVRICTRRVLDPSHCLGVDFGRGRDGRQAGVVRARYAQELWAVGRLARRDVRLWRPTSLASSGDRGNRRVPGRTDFGWERNLDCCGPP